MGTQQLSCREKGPHSPGSPSPSGGLSKATEGALSVWGRLVGFFWQGMQLLSYFAHSQEAALRPPVPATMELSRVLNGYWPIGALSVNCVGD